MGTEPAGDMPQVLSQPRRRGPRATARVPLAAALGLWLVAAGCPGPPPPEPPAPLDPALAALDELAARSSQRPGRHAERNLEACLARVAREHSCAPTPGVQHRVGVRLALDPRYAAQWPGWRARLASTFRCVNHLYRPTGIEWHVSSMLSFEPGAERHDLYALLARLQREFPPDRRALTLGITVWDERHVYRTSGGEIGLSQRGHCVVPSWPRVENDCIILAHELGHLIGAKHVPGKQWVMGWAATPFYLPASDPLARVVATYRFHPRNVAAIQAHQSARFTADGLTPTPACAARIAALDACWSL
ncbi:MAG: hypothetical protein IT371_17635 [Deltaproteobacteria bacterium]|nr:hypothetical protein [Deltaproteobacteria bacterium]